MHETARLDNSFTAAKKYLEGFTLIESMVVVAIVGIFAAIAAPSFTSIIQSTELQSSSQDLLVALGYARSESIKRGYPVTVCKSATVGAASPSCATSGDWTSGWLVFVDFNQNGSIDTSGSNADTILRVESTLPTAVKLKSPSNYSKFITFFPNGSAVGDNQESSGKITLCTNGQARVVSISSSGHGTMSKATC